MPRVAPILRTGSKALKDIDLLRVLQTEISHELSNERLKDCETGSLGKFHMNWDSPKSRDVLLKRKYESGEEVYVSALLSRDSFIEGGSYPWEALMKICVKKPGLSSLFQLDCSVYSEAGYVLQFDVHKASYIQSPTSLGTSVYRGPGLRTLDPKLQEALKQYVIGKGIGNDLNMFLLYHLHKKEQDQYINWLQKVKDMVTKAD